MPLVPFNNFLIEPCRRVRIHRTLKNLVNRKYANSKQHFSRQYAQILWNMHTVRSPDFIARAEAHATVLARRLNLQKLTTQRGLQNKFTQVFVLADFFELPFDEVAINTDLSRRCIRAFKADVFQ